MTSPQTIVVTGAAGFIGRRLVARLTHARHDVIAWTRASGDLRDSQAVRSGLAGLNPGVIFHLAASDAASAEGDWTAPAAETAMVQSLADALPSGARLICTGSMSEHGYGGTLDEDDPRRSRSLYGFAKAAATDRAVALAAAGVADIRVARLFGVYGPGEGPTRLLPHLVSNLAAGRVTPLGDEARVRDFVHVDDVCALLIRLADVGRPPHPVVNIGTGVGVTIEHVCRRVADWLGADPALLRFGEFANRAIDEDVLIARTRRLAELGPVPAQHWLADTGPARDYVMELASSS